jgi:predicted S18 family serine protease
MNTSKLLLITLTVLLLAIPFSTAITNIGHIKLLAVYQEGETFKGSSADVELEIKEGQGRVFLETVPLSKMDTQISTRFAKEMACKYANVDCSNYDFFYTIISSAGIVGGPSAGGAISALTFAMLEDLNVDQTAAMTGTINSGGLIGPIGSLKEKIMAAKEAGIMKVLIPTVQANQKEDNLTDNIEYGKQIGIEVIPVATIEDAVHELTGKEFTYEDKEISVPETYTSIMKDVAKQLCDRTKELSSELDVFNLKDKKEVILDQVTTQLEVQNLTEKGEAAFESGNYYSSASYCFGASVKANALLYEMKNLTAEEKFTAALALKKKIDDFDNKTESRQKETITDLQTYMIVKERILESRQNLALESNNSDSLAYVDERLNSAIVWSGFFGNEGDKYNLDQASLESSCTQILGEVDERFQYLTLFFPGLLNNLRNNLVTAHKYAQTENYALCIYLASRTKAEANILVTLLGVKEEFMDELLKQKLMSTKRAITSQIDNGIFPIIAYSYYEYANSLAQENKYSALLYSEYALELSNIDIYFVKKSKPLQNVDIRTKLKEYLPTIMLIWGLILGYILAIIVRKERKTKSAARTEGRTRLLVNKSKRKLPTRTKLRIR